MALFTVTNLNDSGAGSLRDAIAQANAAAGADEIQFSISGTIEFDLTRPASNPTIGTALTITDDLIINGDTNNDLAADITLDARGGSRVFDVVDADVTFRSLEITGGGRGGGGIRADGTSVVSVINSSIHDNSTSGTRFSYSYVGGGISATTLYVANSTIYDNDASRGAGVAISSGGTGVFDNVTISGNNAAYGGAAIVAFGGDLTIRNSTIANNFSSNPEYDGAANIVLQGAVDVDIVNSIISGNSTSNGQVGTYLASSYSVTAQNSLLGTGTIVNTDNGGNIFSDTPGLASLADNGGPVQTRALQPGSLAIAGGDAGALPTDTFDIDNDGDTAEILPIDANGLNRVTGPLDIGAVEVAPPRITVDTLDDIDNGDYSAGDLSLREAITQVDDGGIIEFDASLSGGTIRLDSELVIQAGSDFAIDGDINGDGVADITVSGDTNGDGTGQTSLFVVNAGAQVVIDTLNLTKGYGAGYTYGAGAGPGEDVAGAITNNGTLTLIDTSVTDSTAAGSYGGYASYLNGGSGVGGILNAGTLNIIRGTFDNNQGMGGSGASGMSGFVSGDFGGFGSDGGDGVGDILNLFGSTLTLSDAVFDGSTGIGGGGGGGGAGGDGDYGNYYGGDGGGGGNGGLGIASVLDRGMSSGTATITTGSATAGVAGVGGGGGLGYYGGGSGGGGAPGANGPDGSAGSFDRDFFGINPTDPDLTIIGTGIADEITGATGDDTLVGGASGDILDGGVGSDTASYINAPATGTDGVEVDLQDTSQNAGDAVGDTYISIENLAGSNFDDKLYGNASDNTLNGFDGDDVLRGREGVDSLNGGAGDDVLRGGDGADQLSGSSGTDQADYADAGPGLVVDFQNTANNTGDAVGDTYSLIEDLRGSVHSDALRGDASNNAIFGLGGNDVLLGRDGDDTLYGSSGDDVLTGGNGADTLIGGNGTDLADYSDIGSGLVADLEFDMDNAGGALGDTLVSIENLNGSGFDDNLYGDAISNAISGNAGDDVLRGRGGTDDLSGGDGNDVLRGGTGSDTLNGGAGIDQADYADAGPGLVVDLQNTGNNTGDAAGDTYSSIDNIRGSTNDDNLRGDAGENTIFGLSGDDFIVGRDGDDTLIGSSGNDILRGGDGADQLVGGNGIDTADYRDVGTGLLADLVFSNNNVGGAFGDTYVTIENVFGTGGDDSLRGNAADNEILGGGGDDFLVGRNGSDTLIGNSGDDVLRGGRDADVLDGGNGQDRADYTDATFNVRADLQNSAVNVGAHALGDTYISIEDIRGSSGFKDDLRGDAGDNVLQGLGGDDILTGRAGNDTLQGSIGDDVLTGGAGNDILIGGGGADTFIYNAPNEGVDSIIGFTINSDMIHLDDSGFTSLSAGALAAGNFRNGASAVDANDFLVYDGTTLFYDADGSGAGAQVALATFNNGAALDENDFLII